MVWFCKFLVAALSCLWVVTLGIRQVEIYDEDMTAFNQLLDKLNLTFDNATELIHRLNNFNKAKEQIQQFESRYPGATFEINKFSLKSKEELQKVSFDLSLGLCKFFNHFSFSTFLPHLLMLLRGKSEVLSMALGPQPSQHPLISGPMERFPRSRTKEIAVHVGRTPPRLPSNLSLPFDSIKLWICRSKAL